MGHHGSDEMNPEMMRAFAAERDKIGKEESVLQKIAASQNTEGFGATGNYPMGTLGKGDEGEISFGVASHRGKVIINFGKPVAWLGMDARQAASLAALLIQHANRCRNIGGGREEAKATAKEHATTQ